MAALVSYLASATVSLFVSLWPKAGLQFELSSAIVAIIATILIACTIHSERFRTASAEGVRGSPSRVRHYCPRCVSLVIGLSVGFSFTLAAVCSGKLDAISFDWSWSAVTGGSILVLPALLHFSGRIHSRDSETRVESWLICAAYVFVGISSSVLLTLGFWSVV